MLLAPCAQGSGISFSRRGHRVPTPWALDAHRSGRDSRQTATLVCALFLLFEVFVYQRSPVGNKETVRVVFRARHSSELTSGDIGVTFLKIEAKVACFGIKVK